MDTLAHTLNAIKQQASQSTQPLSNKVLADCLFRDLKLHGLKDKDIVNISSELIAQLTNDIKSRAEKVHANAAESAAASSTGSEKLARTIRP